ncbi:MAG: hypothetical protein JXR46_01620 [Calditrichaceae bacterium]|nr:hypothetical protein [Calditrichaceae bacterium]MBN2707717.1 hypothetical protein [Calditrichaceae bacterium]RQV96467.1 MAG: hypothetical protein EH224_04420 [Calditrichota bacterium]
MAESINQNTIPQTFILIRKLLRLFALFWFVIALIIFVFTLIDIIEDPDNPDVWLSLLGVFAICIPAYLLWKIPDWLISRYKRFMASSVNNPEKEIQTKKVETGHGTYEHLEITNKADGESFIEEDRFGNVIFDITQRSIRLIFGGSFLLIGVIIGSLIFYFSSDIGMFEYFFVGGWIIFCLIAMGFVYEVTINKSIGMLERKSGWFFFVFKRSCNLSDFSGIEIESVFYRQKYDTLREHYRSEDPKFRVNLTGQKQLNLKVFGNLSDARHMGEEVSKYLKLPLHENFRESY